MFCNLKDDVTELELPEKLAKKFRLFTWQTTLFFKEILSDAWYVKGYIFDLYLV